MNRKTSALIGALTVTAIAMAAVLLTFPSQNADAAMINVQPGFTLITSGSSGGGDETLTVLDKNSGKLIMYKLSAANNFELMGGTNLNEVFK